MSNLYRGYRNKKFSDVFPEFEDFKWFYDYCGIERTIREETTESQPSNSLQNLYYLMLARYANSTIASSDENRFKFQVMSIIFQYGPTWEKRLEIQKSLRASTEDDLRTSMTIYNQAENPENAPGTTSTTGVDYINRQTVQHHVRNKIDAFMQLSEVMRSDVTGEFLNKFKPLFIYLPPEYTLLYKTELEDEDDD